MQLLLGDAGCITQRGPCAIGNSLPRSGRNSIATKKFQLLQGRFPQDFQQVCGPIRTFGVFVKAPGVLTRRLCGEKDGNLLPLLLQVTFACPTIWNCLFHIFGFSLLPKVVKETAMTMALTFEKTRRLTNWPNIATKFARRGTMRSLLLSSWSSWHHAASATQWTEFESNDQSSTSPQESCARLPAGMQPHRHWCHHQSTWSAQTGTVGIKGRQSVTVPLASDFCMSDHFQLTISHFWPFNVAKCCQRNSRDNGPWHSKKIRHLNVLDKHRNQVCKTRHHEKLASLKLVQLAPWSFCHAVDGIWAQHSKFNFSRGEFRKTSSRSAAPSAPLVASPKHLECSKGDCEDKLTAICRRSSCEWLLHVWPFATVYLKRVSKGFEFPMWGCATPKGWLQLFEHRFTHYKIPNFAWQNAPKRH